MSNNIPGDKSLATVQRSDAGPVTITIRGHRAWMEPTLPEELRDAIGWQALEPMVADGNLTLAPTGPQPFMADDSPAAFLFAGLVPRVVAHLRRRGFNVRVIDQIPIWVPANDKLIASHKLSFAARGLLAAVHGNTGGQILVSSERQAAWAVKLLCRLYSEARSLVITKNQTETNRLYRQFGQLRNRPVTCYPELSFKPRQIMFCPQPPLGWINNLDWEQVIVVGKEPGLSMNSLQNVRRLYYQMRFCIRTTDDRLDRLELLRLEATFGPVRYCSPAGGEALAIVSMVPAPMDTYTIGDASQSNRRQRQDPQLQGQQWQRQRQHLWHSHRRNQFIAGLASALFAKDIAALETYAVSDPDQLVSDARRGVRILVETPEHGRALKQLLPEWELFDERPAMAEKEHEIHHAIVDLCPAIVTFAQAAREGLGGGVIIRVDGTPTPWQRCWTPPSEQPFSLVDLADDFDREATTSWQRRLANYRSLGWSTY